MRVFVTGATGFVGSAIVQELINAGHQVLGLTRSDAGAKTLIAAGAEVHRGDLTDLESIQSGVAMADGVIHTGFIHDFTQFKASCETDRQVIQAIGSALIGSNRPLIITSGTGLVKGNPLATEDIIPDFNTSSFPRVATEEAAMAVAAQGVHTIVLRLPPTVHGDGDHGFVPVLIGLAREKGVSAYVGDGINHWAAVHRLDAARLYRLALEKGIAGARYHAAAEEGVPFRDMAGVIGRQLNVPVVSKTHEEAADHFGWFGHFAGMDNQVSSAQTRRQLGWQPNGIGLISDLEQGSYFG
ncbi:Nucleoside-diphosphate-sugar epimerase [Mucilaginibacter lappiensis]|uniref:Nucleoside-diphosphate-sugar epimerase n=1 Tax=Mucilaginibacter lappiensis TaxID=354630 RepID=A0ABR6PMD9_9SPHI|nr:SDR family oxidoreductase [Mucilaginibacter lappiensis]MBB6110936.1 nucleoside-diphosphate-sugar epimerase [Mucilaginibacter lappiensis]SIR60132.1 Nucleoside-diphosphate-sugar epimerase [Mucilaginibacter lappiensis]